MQTDYATFSLPFRIYMIDWKLGQDRISNFTISTIKIWYFTSLIPFPLAFSLCAMVACLDIHSKNAYSCTTYNAPRRLVICHSTSFTVEMLTWETATTHTPGMDMADVTCPLCTYNTATTPNISSAFTYLTKAKIVIHYMSLLHSSYIHSPLYGRTLLHYTSWCYQESGQMKIRKCTSKATLLTILTSTCSTYQ